MSIVIKPSPETHPSGVLACWKCKANAAECKCEPIVEPDKKEPNGRPDTGTSSSGGA